MTPAQSYQQMASIIARAVPADGERETAIPGLFISRQSSPTQPLHTAQWPCFAFVVQGAKSLVLASDTYRYGIGDYLVLSVDLPVISRVTQADAAAPHLGVGMAIDPAQVRQVLDRTGAPPVPAGQDLRGVAVNAMPPELVEACLRLLRLLQQPADIAAMAPLIQQEILYRLLAGPCGPRLVQIATAETASNRIARCIDWLKGNYHHPLRISELAAHAGMSVSSLHHSFKAITAMTPLQFQKQLRLHEARRLMLVERLDAGSAGYAVGYQSPSQFSRDYSRLYGMPPLRDIGRVRQTNVA